MPFAIAAIRHGREVGGPYEPYRVGVRVEPVDFEPRTMACTSSTSTRTSASGSSSPPPTVRTRCGRSSLSDLGAVEPDVAAGAVAAAVRFLGVAGVRGDLRVGSDPVALSYALCALTPGLVPDRQAARGPRHGRAPGRSHTPLPAEASLCGRSGRVGNPDHAALRVARPWLLHPGRIAAQQQPELESSPGTGSTR